MNTTTKTGTISGTLLIIAANIHCEDIFRTIVLACIGAVVSFVMSLLLKIAYKHFKK